jgi:hypothetical protein
LPGTTATPRKAPAKKTKKETAYARRKKAGRRMLTIEVDKQIHERMHAQAAAENRTVAGLARVAIEEHLDAADA